MGRLPEPFPLSARRLAAALVQRCPGGPATLCPVRTPASALALAAEEDVVRDLGFRTAAYVFSDPGTARTLGDVLHMLDAPGLQVGAYRVGADRVATATPLPADPRAELHRVYGGLGWTVPHLLDHCPEPANLYYDRVAQVQMSGWSRGRVVLVGDACQAPSLLTGQGAGMALSGAAALADRLHSDDVATALARYEDDLKPVVDRLQADGRAVAEECVPA